MTQTSALTAALFAASLLLSPAVQAEEAAGIDAFATWELDGTVVKSGPEEATLVGSLAGPVFIDSGKGPTYAGQILCPGTLTIRLEDGSQTGEGVCAFHAKDGAEAYGKWRCAGYHMVGCKGDFVLTGGSGRLEGMTGESELLIRGELLEAVKMAGSAATQHAVGIILWHDLRATLPGQQ
ncbi:MAG TPA: hypothetical protein VJL84_10110 [Kiloniellales bacterium]|nr:hypothetical protein [Kiloniellales bacterium]